jgi:hypothetical protein
MALRDLIERGLLKVNDIRVVDELLSFAMKGSQFNALSGSHDDMVANLWLFAHFVLAHNFEIDGLKSLPDVSGFVPS